MCHPNLHALGQRVRDGGENFIDCVGDFERISGRLLYDANGDGGLAIEANDPAFIQRSQFRLPHVAQTHEITVGVLDDEIVELLWRTQVGLRQNGELPLLTLDASRGHFHILAAQRVLDVLRRKLIGGETLRIEPNAHGVGAIAE